MISLLLAAATSAPALAKGVAAATAAPKQIKLTPQQIQQLMQQQQAAQQAPQIVPHTWFQDHAGWLTHGLAGLFVICAIALIALLAVQTTKQEGLSGTIGGRVESAYGRMGAEEQIKRLTGVVAIGFVVIGTILSLTGI
ncbi:MAG: preprotein translocase subunit SecG [Vulcanimicrobiaceae bacterium]